MAFSKDSTNSSSHGHRNENISGASHLALHEACHAHACRLAKTLSREPREFEPNQERNLTGFQILWCTVNAHARCSNLRMRPPESSVIWCIYITSRKKHVACHTEYKRRVSTPQLPLIWQVRSWHPWLSWNILWDCSTDITGIDEHLINFTPIGSCADVVYMSYERSRGNLLSSMHTLAMKCS